MRKRSVIMFAFAFPFLLGTQTSSPAQEDQPTIAKDSVQVNAFTFGVYRKNYDVWRRVLECRRHGMFIEPKNDIEFLGPIYVRQSDISLLTELTRFVLAEGSINIAPLRGWR